MDKVQVVLSPDFKDDGFYDEATRVYFNNGKYDQIYEFPLDADLTGIKRRIRVGHLMLVDAPDGFSVGNPDSGDRVFKEGFEKAVKYFDSSSGDEASLQKEVNDLKAKVTTLEGQVNTLTSDKTKLTNENTSLKSQVTSLQTDKTNLEKQVTDLTTDNQTKANRITELEARVAELEAELAAQQPTT